MNHEAIVNLIANTTTRTVRDLPRWYIGLGIKS